MKKEKLSLVFLASVFTLALFSFNTFAAENDLSNQNKKGVNMAHYFGPCSSELSFSDWKNQQIQRIESVTEEMFNKVQKGKNAISLEEWKNQQIQRIESMTEEEFESKKEYKMKNFKHKTKGRLVDMTNLDYESWKEKMIEKINSIPKEEFENMKAKGRNFQNNKESK